MAISTIIVLVEGICDHFSVPSLKLDSLLCFYSLYVDVFFAFPLHFRFLGKMVMIDFSSLSSRCFLWGSSIEL